MEQTTVKTKKHLKLPVKALLFLVFVPVSCLPALLTLIAASVADSLLGNDVLTTISVLFTLVSTLFLVFFSEHIICKRTDMPSSAFRLLPSVISIICFIIFIIELHTLGEYYVYSDIDTFVVYICILGIISAVMGFITFRKTKNRSLILFCVLSLVACFCLNPACSLYKNMVLANIGESDRTSSWNSINQLVTRSSDWQRIVTDTPFKLGEVTTGHDEVWDEDYYSNTLGTYPFIDGSTVCVPMAVEFARQHLGFDDENSSSLANFSTTHHAYENLVLKEINFPGSYSYNNNYVELADDTVDLVIATHPSEDELAMAQNNGVELILKPVCYDAFVFITHKDNPVDSLTVQQIKDIYSGKITNWKDVGGKDEKIRAFQREENSGSQTAMERLVMGGTDMIDPIKVTVVEGMGALVEAVAEYENETASLGYTYRYYIDNLYKNDNIKTISIEGIPPTDENIRNASYPYTTNYYGVIRKQDENGTGGNFLRWMLSDEGQKCIKQAGYITMK